jgi:GT2 family glycosyltransferase
MTDFPSNPVSHAVIIPFMGRFDMLAGHLDILLKNTFPNSHILLVDDGSQPPATDSSDLTEHLENPRVTLLRHKHNKGVAAARNSAMSWCRQHNIELVIMLDSDCIPPENFIEAHLSLHERYPSATCIGGGIVGVGKGFWARLDNIISWIHSMPYGDIHEIYQFYHLPTTNLSVKMRHLPDREKFFDSRLKTGEDALFIRELQAAGKIVMFSPLPSIQHRDRESLSKVLKHHYEWGHHQYFIQLGGDISPRCFHPFYRFFFLLAFIPCLPFYALLGAFLNTKPWLTYKLSNIFYFPFIYVIWLCKSFAVAEAALRPRAVMRHPE